MKYFLNEKRRTELAQTLVEVGEDKDRIKIITDVEDDLFDVDLALTAHIQMVIEFRDKNDAGQAQHASIGLICSMALMEEAMERGLDETDFPMMLHAIKQDLGGRYGMTAQ